MTHICDIITLATGITASVVLAMVLFTVAWVNRDDKTRYSILLCMYSAATLLDSVLMLCLLYTAVNNMNYLFLQYFIQPTIVSTETCLGAFAIFRILRGSSKHIREIQFSCYVFIGVVLLYPVLYGLELGPEKEFWNISNYLVYARSTVGIFLSALIYITALTFNLFTSTKILRLYLIYKEKLQEYFSFDLVHVRHTCMAWWGLCLAYVVLAYINIYVVDHAVHHALRYLMIIAFTGMVLILISHENMLKRIDTAFRSISIHNLDPHINAEESQDVTEVRRVMEHWAKRSDKPFNEKGITLKSVSEDMKLPMEVVRKYVRICYGMGFRSWILALRDEAET